METTVIIVGAGPSGLSTAACLSRASIPYKLLEREDCSASLWRKYAYDRLCLHLPKKSSELAFMEFPSSFPNYVPKKMFLEYLDSYISNFGIDPLYRRKVEAAEYDRDLKKWKVRVRNSEGGGEIEEEYVGRFLVVATGETADPYMPVVEGMERFGGEVMHSTRYKSGKGFEGKNVLVVGAGNSGMEIALDLASHGATTSILVRSPIHIMSRRMMKLQVLLGQYLALKFLDSLMVFLSKMVFGELSKYGMKRWEKGPIHMKRHHGKFPVIDVGTFDKIKSGEIQVISSEISMVESNNNVMFKDGKLHPFHSIIFCTGFTTSAKLWLKDDDYLLNDDGLSKVSPPNHWKGKNGLYCVGLSKRGLYGSKVEAQEVANDIAAQLHCV
ncbi:probable indole-3-pyruvate monooxygenase YUCCA10 [Cucurbita moschata]|uniref:Flavin-containing monooxygenase n=1 Tax=Cucurbita moschata TaxID=3662 RepID=A0A6J1GQQ5_CUCMO|nr:probable indole-3-pyruvate monooxygenase YUCCA10 [Cucurbita moschata]